MIKKYKREVTRVSQKALRGTLKQVPGKGIKDSFEFEVNTMLRKAL